MTAFIPPSARSHLIAISRLRRAGGREVSILKLRGVVQAATDEQFERRLAEAGDRSCYLLVDLSDLEELTPPGLERLRCQAGWQDRRGGWLRVVSPAAEIATLLASAGGVLPVFACEDDALADLAPRVA